MGNAAPSAASALPALWDVGGMAAGGMAMGHVWRWWGETGTQGEWEALEGGMEGEQCQKGAKGGCQE